MGLLDSILGNLGGAGNTRGASSSSMSPLVKAILLLLAAKAAQSVTAPRSAPQGQLGRDPETHDGGALSGGLGGLLGAGAGGLGGLLSGGLGSLVEQLRNKGLGDQVDSWIGTGQNKPVDPGSLGHALGPDALDELERATGMKRDEVLTHLSHELPDAVDHVTPEGRLPVEDELARQFSQPR
jgi:uncharacterized protein YidB (DUF937 family)